MTTANDRNRLIIEEFRANKGNVGGGFAGRPLLLLTTQGRKTGETRINPLMHLPDGDRWIVFASKGGAPKSPDWYHNLVANPLVTLEIGTETFEAEATEVTGEERDLLYARQAQLYPVFAEYETKTTRKIPVIAMSRKR
jgi:deazaflavin-dependent oxidoreductase (nitroreductase family)